MLIQAHSEWRDIPDIIKITFKGVYQVVKNQTSQLQQLEVENDALKDSLNNKANLGDLKKTM